MPYRLVGLDTFEGAYYPIEGEYATAAEANAAAQRRLVELEKGQPSASSGGQYGGIQDRVFVEGPDGTRTRIFPDARKAR